MISDNKAIANNFATYFCNVSENLAKKIGPTPIDIEKSIDNDSNNIFLVPTSHNSVFQIT